MHLTPREMEKLYIYQLAEVAEKRKAKGLKLNHPETMSIICAAALEGEYHLARQGGRRLGLCGRGARGKRHVHGVVSFFRRAEL